MAIFGWGWSEDQRPYPRLCCEREPDMDSSSELLGFLATCSAMVLVSVADILAAVRVDECRCRGHLTACQSIKQLAALSISTSVKFRPGVYRSSYMHVLVHVGGSYHNGYQVPVPGMARSKDGRHRRAAGGGRVRAW